MIIHVTLRQDTSAELAAEIILSTSMADVNERRLKVFNILSGAVPDETDLEALKKHKCVTNVESEGLKSVRKKEPPPAVAKNCKTWGCTHEGDSECTQVCVAVTVPQPVVEEGVIELAEEVTAAKTLEAEFDRLAAAWKQETGGTSSAKELVSNPNYKAIIALGKPVVPLLLQEIRQKPGFWFYALRAITMSGPEIPKTIAGNVPAICRLWVEWGEKNGLLT
jgi:hypothetical protein